MATDKRAKLAAAAIQTRVMILGSGLLLAWFVGTYALDWVRAPGWAYAAWLAILAASAIIGGNIYLYYLRGGPTRRDWLLLALGMIAISLGLYVAWTGWSHLQ